MEIRCFSKIFGVLILLSAVFTLNSPAHTYHTSLTRIDFNQEAKSFEIEINLFNHDLEKVLEKKYKKRIDFEKTKEIDKLILDYLSETFLIKDAKNNEKKLVWVGKEIATDLTTVYIEVKDIEDFEKLTLQNKIFFEIFTEQINLVTLHLEEKKYDLGFKLGDGFKNFISETKN